MNGPEHYAEAERLLVEGRELANRARPIAGERFTAANSDLGGRAALKFQEAAVHVGLARVALMYDLADAEPRYRDGWSNATS